MQLPLPVSIAHFESFPYSFHFSFSSVLFEIIPNYLWKTRFHQAFPEICYIKCLKRSVTANICKAPGETCGRIEIDDASVEPLNCWAPQLLRTPKSFVFVLLWFWFCILEGRTSFKNKLSKEAIGGRSNQVLLREKELLHSSVFHEEKRPKCPKYHQLFVHKDGVSYPTGEFQRRLDMTSPAPSASPCPVMQLTTECRHSALSFQVPCFTQQILPLPKIWKFRSREC